MSLLSVKHLTKNFGGLCAVSNVSMEINEHELIGLIGPNGARQDDHCSTCSLASMSPVREASN